ncbi:MAG: hypothetical protein H6609_19335 [Ignavibacteriales bacterium]|nr:hypothetical protein [Ignavibacteriales bacterium]
MNDPIPIKYMKKKLEDNFDALWMESFGILESNEVMLGGIRVKKDNKDDVKKLKKKISKMKEEVSVYRDECHKYFNPDILERMERDLDAFKNNVFGNKLWTVHSALHDMSNKELDRYRDSFENATAKEIYEHVKYILQKAKDYVENVYKTINYKTVQSIDDLKLDFLYDENMLLAGVIGLGIRSELLHRMYPAVFPIMTRRSLWGMFFLTDESEFVVDETWDGRSRTSHQWEYEYDRFCFYSNFLTNIMEVHLNKYKITIDPVMRYGYLNLMLVEYSRKHQKEADELYRWKYTGLK